MKTEQDIDMKKVFLFSSLAVASFLISGVANAVEKVFFPVNKHPEPQVVQKSDWKGCYRGHHVPEIPQDFYDMMVVTADGNKPKLEDVKKVLMLAASDTGWEVQKIVEDGQAGKFIATKNVHNKHSMTVQVYYSPEKFSIIYLSSSNLSEANCGGRIFLHRNYNVWVNQLKTAMSRQLMIM